MKCSIKMNNDYCFRLSAWEFDIGMGTGFLNLGDYLPELQDIQGRLYLEEGFDFQ